MAVNGAQLLLSVALSYAAGLLLKQDPKTPVRTDKPTTLSTRGSVLNWHVGIRRLAPVFGWAGEREKTRGARTGGKGGGGRTYADLWLEAGVHWICVGPCRALHEITSGGKTIFRGPITSDSHPSGSTVDLGDEGSFTIYWGETDQPVNSYLGDSSRLGIASRWPFICYVVWNKKKLGNQPLWPDVQYVVERRPQTSTSDLLPGSDGWYDPVGTIAAPTYDITDFVANADADTGYLEFGREAGYTNVRFPSSTDLVAQFPAGGLIRLSGNGISDGDYTIRKSELATLTETVSIDTSGSTADIEHVVTRVYLEDGTVGADDNGTGQAFEYDTSDGANWAHVAAELLFATWPQGLGLPTTGREPWDLTALDTLGAEAETNGWRASVQTREGDTAQGLLAGMMQDHGVFLVMDTRTGKMEFKGIRTPSGTLSDVKEETFDNLPEIVVNHGPKDANLISYTFVDRDLEFSESPLSITDDGEIENEGHARAQKVDIVSTTYQPTASDLAYLRAQEATKTSPATLKVSRMVRELETGDAFTIDGFDQVQRLLNVTPMPDSEAWKIQFAPDFYGVPLTDFKQDQTGNLPDNSPPVADPAFALVELPEPLVLNQQRVIIPRIRDSVSISGAIPFISRTGSTYTQLNSILDTVQAGGTLDAEFSADTANVLDQGPEFTVLGEDNGSVATDLSADLVTWGLGQQLVLLWSPTSFEVCFLQKSTAVDATTRRLDGLMRGRYDTRRQTHPAGTAVFIVDADQINLLENALIEPGETLFAKVCPTAPSGTLPLSSAPAIPYVLDGSDTIYGKGVRPAKPDPVVVRAPNKGVAAYFTGDDVTVRARPYSADSVATGAGLQGYGSVIADPVIPGTLVFELTTDAATPVVVDTKEIDPNNTLEVTWTNAELVAALGSEVDFQIRYYHSGRGYVSSTSDALIIEKL